MEDLSSAKALRVLNPSNYGHLGFTTTFCQGCKYLSPCAEVVEDNDRVKICNNCIPAIDKFYLSGKSVRVVQDMYGKNIAGTD